MMKKIAITGATGFIGKRLAMRHLAQGDHVRILTRRRRGAIDYLDSVHWFYGDLTASDDLSGFVDGVDILYHCAGEIRDKSLMEKVHVSGTRRLIDAASGRIGRWVQLSSVGAYGRIRSGVVTESTALNPCGAYEVTKTVSDQMVTEASLKGLFQHVIVRPSNVYGPEMTNRSLFHLISMIRRGLFFFIGSPGASANYIHVDNVVEALFLVAQSSVSAGEVYNISDYRTLELFVNFIATKSKVKAPFMRIPEFSVRAVVHLLQILPRMPLTLARIDALTSRAVYATDKIEKQLGYSHSVSMEDGLEELIDSYVEKKF